MSTVLPFPTTSIIVNGRKRKANPARVQTLADSIRQLGLLNPITVTHEGVLVAGLHRLEAVLLLQWEEVPAHVVTLDSLQAELAEIDENLIRHNLTELEESVQLARRKQIYETLYPATRAGVAGGQASVASKRGQPRTNVTMSFAKDSADKMSQSQRTVERKVQIGEALSEVFGRLEDTPVAKSQKALLALAQMDEEEREEIVELLEAGEAQTIGQARRIINEEAQSYAPDDLPKDVSDRCLLICGDLEEAGDQIADESVDAIITFPPHSHLWRYEELATLAARVLKPGGSLLCSAGPEHLPELFALMTPHLDYHWTISSHTLPSGYPSRKMNTSWEAILWFTNGPYKGPWAGDYFHGDNDARERLIKITVPGDTILDPYMGSDVLIGRDAVRMNRRFIGMDERLEAVETAYARLRGIRPERAAAD